MMWPAWLTLVGAVLVCMGGVRIPSPKGSWTPWPGSIALATGAAIAGAWWLLPPSGWAGDQVQVIASAGGPPVGSVVELTPVGAPRAFRWIALAQTVDSARELLMAGVVASVAVAVALWGSRGRFLSPAPALGVSLVPSLAALTAFAFISKATGPGAADTEGVKAILEAALASGHHGQPVSFTVPEPGWAFVAPGVTTLGAIGVAGVLIALTPRLPLPGAILVRVGAMLAAAAPVWLMVQTQGIPWRPLEGTIWGAGLLAVVVALDDDAHGALRRATLAGAALCLGALAISL
ncbi:MAG: hypothetical protein ACE366_07020 [Bradymonadia bacterium]